MHLLKETEMIIMALKQATKRIEYMCSYCGRKIIKSSTHGRPDPGICPRKVNGGPHSWRINRKY